ncbi:non-hydrolyzing UDP-N-acetylglucosamine 2-epimerase [Amycolatopsis sp. NPDC058986]|uniref:non-hydrolyzing UDP-N-acetylglucosamine 2-epimerase n=1 Tax=unclassified Amycolatopsis TaxID=2618356 RepID=UPI00366C3C0C
MSVSAEVAPEFLSRVLVMALMKNNILMIAGTRPEAVKLAPVALAMAGHASMTPQIVASGQHPAMVGQALEPFDLPVDRQLSFARGDGGLASVTGGMLGALDGAISEFAPSAVVVQGDTATTLAGALAAFWRGVPVVHVEAGLRTGNLRAPFPEEANRVLVSRIASLHLAPTEAAARALLAEGAPSERVVVTGNTVVDALHHIAAKELPIADPDLREGVRDARRLMLVTMHRRESWGDGIDRVLTAVRKIVAAHLELWVVLPAHPNPAVRAQIEAALRDTPRVTITGPLAYSDLVWVMRRSALIVTDSGGIQEEAPSFAVPVLVTREVTERREAVESGSAWLVGTDDARIVEMAERLLANKMELAARNPYGAGDAGCRTVRAIESFLGLPAAEMAA